MFLELFHVALLHRAQSGQAPVGSSRPEPTRSIPAPPAASQDGSTLSTAPDISYEDQVLANLQQKDMGPVKLEAMALPPEYLRRVADRIIQSSFEEQFRIVVPDPKPDGTDPSAPAGSAPAGRKLWLQVAGAIVGALCVWIGSRIMRRRQAGAR